MNWRSDPAARAPTRGFTLVETLVAMAVLALVVGSVLAGVTWTLGRTADRTDRAWLLELARSVADEYRVTLDPALAEGRAAPDLAWRLTTAPSPVGGGRLDEVTVTAWRVRHAARSVTLSVLVPGAGP